MRSFILIPMTTLAASPSLAAGSGLSLSNSDFVVALAFIGFIGILLYAKVPSLLTGMLDQRAEGIRKELDEAKTLREEAQAVLAEFERKQAEVQEQAETIVAHAKSEAEMMAEQAKADLERSIARRLAAAEDQIASAEQSAVREVRDTAIAVSVAAAKSVLAKGMDDSRADALIDASIADVDARLH